MIPFIFTCWLQKSFNVPVVIMLSDDEKFVFREELELENVRNLALENAKDIIAVGFDPELTFIFRNTDYIQHLYKTTLKLQKKTTFNQLRGSFGFDYSTNVGMISYPLLEGAASFSESFPNLFNNKEDIMCLVPQVCPYLFYITNFTKYIRYIRYTRYTKFNNFNNFNKILCKFF